ncbi:hypothetical protein GEMRC1_004271 [Eukaryota sp. GEM-RC1]
MLQNRLERIWKSFSSKSFASNMQLRHRFTNRLRKLDHFPKVEDSFRLSTGSGGCISLLCYLFITVLIISETATFLKSDIQHKLSVDNTVTEPQDVTVLQFDVTFFHLSCPLLSVDLIDSMGQSMIDIHDNLEKTRLDSFGNPVSTSQNELQVERQKDYCGDCYGAAPPGTCCNSCAEVQHMYAKKKWGAGDLSKFEQCRQEGLTYKDMENRKEGCRIAGKLLLSRVLSSFHISPGVSMQHGPHHVHQLTPESTRYNTSHLIHNLSFGNAKHVFIPKNLLPDEPPLVDYVNVNEKYPSFMSKYLLKLVKTEISSFKLDEVVKTYIYSVSRNDIKVDGVNQSSFPGVYFSVDFTGVAVSVSEERKSLSGFLVQIFSIVGGFYACFNIIDSFVFQSVKVIQKKNLGKLS